MRLRTLFAVALLFLGSASSALCSTLQVTASGVFGSRALTTMYSTPGGNFSFSFLVDSSPIVSDFYSGYYTVPAVQNFQYTLNGAADTPADVFVEFSSSKGFSGLLVCLAGCPGNERFRIFSAQIYTGSEAAPSFQAGTFNITDPHTAISTYQSVNLASVSNIIVTNVATTPEPSSLLLLSTGVLGVAGVLRRKLV